MTDAPGAIRPPTITPSEAAIITADVALIKRPKTHRFIIDQVAGSLVISGDVSGVEAAQRAFWMFCADRWDLHPFR